MTKARGGRGGRGGGVARGGRQCQGRNGGKQSLSNPTIDTELPDVPHQRGKQSRKSKQVQNKSSSDQAERRNSRRGKVDNVAKVVPQTRHSRLYGTSKGLQSSGRASPTPASAPRNPFLHKDGTQNPVVTSHAAKGRQTSVLSCVSVLSTKVGRGAYCYRCNRTNRKLRQALFDLLERALKDGRNLIDEWAWEAGVSPDHMDCERTKVCTIPEGVQSVNEPSHRFEAGRTSIFHSQNSQAPGLLQPSAGTHQPLVSRPQQTLNPFIPAGSSVSEIQPPHKLAAQVSSARPWTTANAMSTAAQQTTYAGDVGSRAQASRLQTQQYPHQLQRRDHRGDDAFQATNGGSGNPPCQYPLAQPAKQATLNSCIQNQAVQETYGNHPFLSVPQMMSVQDAQMIQVAQAQQHPLQNQQQLMQTIAAFANIATADHGQDQTIPKASRKREAAPITPPSSNDMSIPSMLT